MNDFVNPSTAGKAEQDAIDALAMPVEYWTTDHLLQALDNNRFPTVMGMDRARFTFKLRIALGWRFDQDGKDKLWKPPARHKDTSGIFNGLVPQENITAAMFSFAPWQAIPKPALHPHTTPAQICAMILRLR